MAVGSYAANAFGVYDTVGNVNEWVEDCWHEDYSYAPTDGSAWIIDGKCDSRILRGGSGSGKLRNLRSAHRTKNFGFTTIGIGFRIARTLSR